MYKWGKKKRHGRSRALVTRCRGRLFLLVVFLYRLHSAIVHSLRFRLFHRLLGFSGLLGTSFGALFALLIKYLFTAKQFEKCLVGAVALIPRGADNAGISAVTVPEPWTNSVKKLHNRFIGH